MVTDTLILSGDCIESLKRFPDNSVDAVVTDPPYGLSKEPDMSEVLRHWLNGDDYQHRGKGFMGKSWDSFVPGPAVWREVLRVLKPGGHVLSFFGTRTYDLGVIAMRLAGFEIRDQLAWMYGSGFPKSLDYAADPVESRKQGRRVPKPEFVGHPQEEGYGTALKPAQEPIVLARKPLVGTVAANVLTHGTGGINVDGGRVGDQLMERTASDGTFKSSNGSMSGHNTGRVKLDSVRGRWPANVILDEAAGVLLDEQTGSLKGGTAIRRNNTAGGETSYSKAHAPETPDLGYGDSGGASRFFYCPKASKAEREKGLECFPVIAPTEVTGRKNTHPTVKPVALMRYLVRLITPPGGIVLDPYTGSGTTGIAAKLEGFRFVGLELSEEYCTIARARIEAW